MAALGALSQMTEMGAFFGIIDASADRAAIVEQPVNVVGPGAFECPVISVCRRTDPERSA